ncbi:hypothetical protein KGF56_000862 [Candida oxycetoniae]|uniref:Alpha-1,3-mannosyltransferase n=1 Tax=Candida oxycetoniae TaxID=497107 RepID=A0AAI9T040_9ASCO|nr:uncharacterized protein KGF56_000862 [Candida oxycetoniae]KAI3406381.2 hypothetical protein KGF56_000862 [Candida oxycetoniae]
MRFSLRKCIYVLLTLLLLSLGVLLLLSSSTFERLKELILDTEKFDPDVLKADNVKAREELHYSKYLYSGYDDFMAAFKNDVQEINTSSLSDKCKVFFNQFNEKHPDWKFPVYNKPSYRFDKSSDKKDIFFKEKIDKLKSSNENKDNDKSDKDEKFVVSRQDLMAFLREYESNVKRSKDIQQEMADVTTMLRVYGKCFIGRDLNEDYEKEMYHELSKKFFPFLTDKLPMVKKPGSSSAPGWPIPQDGNVDGNGDGTFTYKDKPDGEALTEFIYKHSTGRGIVFSASTRYARDIIRLIKVLRAMNNKLPIQILYKSDISKKYIELIEKAATADIESLLDSGSSNDYKSFMPELELLEQHKEYGSEFPKQDLTFINITPCINKAYKYSFPGYFNKILAVLFSTFEEILLLDADTVPLVPPVEFFESFEYQKSGTFFFQDRSLRDTNEFIETNFFATLFPTNDKSIDTLFDIPRTSEKTMNNRYMTGWRHHQEAGVVAFNKKLHFMGLLMMFPLSLWTEPIKSSVWGDKELYWMGLAAAGDENYEFNPVGAASVGEKTTATNRKYYPNSSSNEVCSTHPGHVSKDGKLLWINSGFGFCKKNGYYRERTKFPFSVFESDELTNMFKFPLKIRAALVPPEMPWFRQPNNPIDITPEENFQKSWKDRKKDIDEINENLPSGSERTEFITEWGPQKGWVKNSICFGYYYCAYDRVESYTKEGQCDTGNLYEFTDEEVRHFDYLSKVWFTGDMRNNK